MQLMQHMKATKQFQDWYERRHDYAIAWKQRTGGSVVGGFCTYVPEELLYAAGMLPVRILGSHEPQDVTEPHIFGMYCPFSRDALAQGLKGRYSYVDSIVLSHSCLHFRQAFTSWQLNLPVRWSYYLPMPNAVQSPRALPFQVAELKRFRNFIEEQTGSTITPQALAGAVALLDENRRLLRRVFELRKASDPPITGAEALYMSVTSQFVDKRDHNEALRAVLAEVSGSPAPKRPSGIRLMTVGSENDDVDFFLMAERLNATVVIDEQCAGTRYFWNECLPGQGQLSGQGDEHPGEPLIEQLIERIAARYLDRPPCPTKDYPERRRFAHVLNLAKEYGVQGAIIMQEKFCDPHEGDNPALRKFLEDHGIPTLLLEFDSTNPMGPLQVRVEAFLETLGEEDLF